MKEHKSQSSGETLSSASSPNTRREFLTRTGLTLAGSALAGVAIRHVHAAEDNTIRLALIGCGSRGSGAAANALEAPGGPVRLIAMADLFRDRLDNSFRILREKYQDRVDVPRERQFVGFDAFRKAIDCLRVGDVALLTTHAAFRATHFDYAVQKGVHVFMEKTFAPDPGGIKRLLRAAFSNLAAIMGRAAVHSGRIITWEDAMASDFKFCPDVDSLNENSPAPVRADAQGRYPAPVPGAWKEV